MSGIVGSRLNIRGSGLVGSLGTDGQVLTSSGAGVGAVYEAAAAGGKVGQVVWDDMATSYTTTTDTYGDSGLSIAITPSADTSYLWVICSYTVQLYGNNTATKPDADIQITDGSDVELAVNRDSQNFDDTSDGTNIAGSMTAYYTTGLTSEETIKLRMKARAGRAALYATNSYLNTTTLTVMEILA